MHRHVGQRDARDFAVAVAVDVEEAHHFVEARGHQQAAIVVELQRLHHGTRRFRGVAVALARDLDSLRWQPASSG